MKTVVLCTVALLVSVALLPALLASGDSSPAASCGVSGPITVVLATIRQIESGGDYQAQSPGSTASGAYQFLDSSSAGYGGYTHAKDAPSDVQDAKAAELAASILDQSAGDVSAVPVSWYIGHVPAPGSPEWDTVPTPSAGNRLTPRQYQDKWMTVYRQLVVGGTIAVEADASATTVGGHGETCTNDYSPAGPDGPSEGGWAFPLPRDAVTLAALGNPHHNYPAIDLLVPEGTPIYALTDGTVVRITDFPHNWWTDGCPHPGCDPCGVGLSVEAANGLRYIYCHGQNTYVHLGDHITAGQHLLDSGNNGQSGAPHLHLELKVAGVQRCPQPLLKALYSTGGPIEPSTLPSSGCSF